MALPFLKPKEETPVVLSLPIEKIVPNPAQPRTYFEPQALRELAASISQHGILQPLSVRRLGGVYELIAGERRLRAAKLLGMAEVPCIVVEADSLRSAELAIIENLQREDLNMFDEASAISALIDLYGLTQEEVAAKLSASPSYVANKLRLLRFDDFERQVIIERRLTERHARALLRLGDARARRDALEAVIARGMNVAETEAYVARLLESDKREKPPKKRTALVRDIRIFYNTVDRAVDIMKRAGI
ncbi:MAG: ParB/RepB/Spo0J family partition protein, partial [Eubacteriales bacterium]|nr:ParB/RepB/Spo0J family partition protein [Eubacteriales bacterium]